MMTSSPPPETNELFIQPDPELKSRRRRSEFWQICWLITLSSLLVSLYAIFLSHRLAPAASQQDLDRSALILAEELGRLSVNHSRFGKVAFLDGDGEHLQISLNRLQATLRLDGIVARQLGFDSLSDLIGKDARDASLLTSELAHLEHELAVSDKASVQGRETFSAMVQRTLAGTGVSGKLKSLKITLGKLKSFKSGSSVPLPSLPEERQAFYAQGDNYAAHVPVPVWQNIAYEFYEIAERPILVQVKDFVPLPESSLASVVQVDAEFEVLERGRQKRIRSLSSCAMIGAPPPRRRSALFMLSFPQGYLSRFSSIKSLFSPANFRDRKGEWMLALDGDIPGQGHLTPLASSTSKQEPSLAAAQALYSFIFSVGPQLVPANLKTLLNKPIAELRPFEDKGSYFSGYANSGLFKDTGAARFALLHQSGPGGKGQRLLNSAFSGKTFAEQMPPFTFPLHVDSGGNISLPEEEGFDLDKVRDFLDALYKTNIAGIESMEIAKTVEKRMQASIDNCQRKVLSLKEELESIKRNATVLKEKGANKNESLSANKFDEQTNSLLESIRSEETLKTSYQKVKRKAMLAAANAREAACSSYEIGAHMSSFLARGLRRISSPFKGYLLSQKIVFIPHLSPIEELELFEPEPLDEEAGINSWLSRKFKVTDIPDAGMYLENQSIVDLWQGSSKLEQNKPLYVFMCSNELAESSREPLLYAGRRTPFANGGLTNLELCYLALQSIDSGAKHPVTWSLLIRDLVYSMAQGGGLPLQSAHPHWCNELGLREDSCPGLAVEVQIRSPVPNLGAALAGRYLQDPDGEPPISLYPPLPAELF